MSKAKKPSESAIETRYILAPHQVNTLGTAFGGVVMSWIDTVAAMVAQRHCNGSVVTASIDQMSFKAPIHIGDHVILKSSINYVGRTSMEVGVQVSTEHPATGERERTTTAYLTFVFLDDRGEPHEVPGLLPETAEEKRRHRNAALRVQARKELIKKLKED